MCIFILGFEYVEFNNVEQLKKMVKKIQKRSIFSRLFRREKKGLAAIMIETLQGEGGIKPATPEFMSAIRELCNETGALFVCDEVQTGMGRTGKLWGYQNFEVEPDVITSAKALGGGVPIGAMLCKEKANVFGPGDHASTYGGNPLACAAGLAVANAFQTENLLQNTEARGEQLRALARKIQAKMPSVITDVRGIGLIIGGQLYVLTYIRTHTLFHLHYTLRYLLYTDAYS